MPGVDPHPEGRAILLACIQHMPTRLTGGDGSVDPVVTAVLTALRPVIGRGTTLRVIVLRRLDLALRVVIATATLMLVRSVKMRLRLRARRPARSQRGCGEHQTEKKRGLFHKPRYKREHLNPS